jgi:uncharacterized protein (TIGR03437 family)
MKRAHLLTPALVSCAILSFALHSSAQRGQPPSSPALQTNVRRSDTGRRIPQRRENFDIRAGHMRTLETQPGIDTVTGSTQARGVRLKRERPSVQMRWSSLTGTPSRIWSFTESIGAPNQGDAATTARRFIREHPDLFQLSEGEVNELRMARRYRTAHNGLTHMTFQQQVNGRDVFQAQYAVHVTRNGSVVAASGELIPGVTRAINASSPRLNAAEALRIAAGEVDEQITGPVALRLQPGGPDQRQEFDRAAGFGDHVKARLVYFPLATNEVRLAWQFILIMLETPDVYFMIMDAERGSLLYLYNLTCYDENPLNPHGQVFTKESPRPNLPVTTNAPPIVEREDLPFRASPYNGKTIFENSNPHYDWWVGVNADNLISNNTSAYIDRDQQTNQPDQPRLAAPDGNFSFPVDLTQGPLIENNQKAAQVNLFYWVNRYHDILYSYGFNEAAGNFQTNNFGLGGIGNDAINAEAQDGSGTNNANFSTPPDGAPGRVQMYLWNGTPQRDGDFDQGVIIHELTHGLSNRLIGNATGLGMIQSGGMGEGWSDWFGLVLLAQEGDDPAGSYAVGQYVTGNYTRGIRRFPYSTNPEVYPLTYKDVSLLPAVHPMGEIWCNTLWEMRALLIRKYGFQEGQRQSIQLVVDGMKLTPIVPSYLDARNAILLADRVNNGGANQCVIWQAFAKRGMGLGSKTLDASDTAPGETFDNAPYCSDTGIITLDKNNYVTGETLRLTLGDRNATGTVAVQINSTATGDVETLLLSPEPAIPGSFSGSVRIAAGRAKSGDGVLHASADRADQINITYNDPNGDNGGPAQINAKALITREKAIFEDDVERGNGGWFPTGLWAMASVPVIPGASSIVWTDSPGGDYGNRSSSSLTSRPLDLTGLSEVTLAFSHKYDLQNRFDYGLVEFSNDNGSTWQRIAAFTGSQGYFAQARISLRVLDGQPMARIRFRITTDAAQVADGWYIDDIRIVARSNNPAIVPPGSVPVPIITSITPASGLPAGGTLVTINGIGFTENETTSVTFDGIPALAINVLGDTALHAITPAHVAGPSTVRVINRNGGAALAGGFTYYTPGSGGGAPALTTLFPNSGTFRGGTAVTILGSNFIPDTEVTFGGQRGVVSFINPGELSVRTPAAAAAGPVEVAASNGAARASLDKGFNYIGGSPPGVSVFDLAGGENFFARSITNIRWRSSDDRGVQRHRISLMRNTGAGLQFVSDIVSSLPGDAQSFSWAIPANIPSPLKARIRVVAIDDEGSETEAFSSNDFNLMRRWEESALLPLSFQRLPIVSDGQFLYALGGQAGTIVPGLVYRLDPSAPTPTWGAPVQQMPQALTSSDAVFLNGRIHVTGGVLASGQVSSNHYAYNIAANNWSTLAPAPSLAHSYALVVDNERGVFYLTGGSANGQTGSTAVSSYNPGTNSWSDLTPMNQARFGHEAALIEGKLYVAGGNGASGPVASAEVYDFNTGGWSPIAPLNRPRFAASSFVAADQGGNPLWFIVGGQESTGMNPGSSATDVYDVRNNRWITLDDSFLPPTLRSNLGGAVHGNYFYTVGGLTPAGGSRATERMRLDLLTPIPADQAPVVAVPETQIAMANNELRFTVTANDFGSGAPIALTADGLPSGAEFTAANISNDFARGTFRWTPTGAVTGQSFRVSFMVSDGQLSEAKLVTIRVVTAGPLTAVNAADFRSGAIAPGSIATAFGTDLALRVENALELPLPFELAGTTLTVNGLASPLLFASQAQVNFIVPESIEVGTATIIVSNPAGNFALGRVQIAPSSPALFTLDASGRGDASAVATADGITFQRQPFDVLVNGRPNVLVLFCTGIRRAQAANPGDDNGVAEAVGVTIDGKPANVLYAGAQGDLGGLDQINVEIPSSLDGGGQRRVEVVVTVNGVTANLVTIQLK